MRQRYASDLTDSQWARLRADVFGREVSPDGLRERVNGVLYREQSRVPWSLLPPNFPPGDLLRADLERWRADGTWARVRDILEAYPAPHMRLNGSALRRLKRALGRQVRMLPGGPAVMPVGRGLMEVSPLLRWLAAFRRRAARTIRKLPGGGVILAPGRWTIQLTQAAMRPFTAHARLPGWYAQAHARLYDQKDYAGADDLYTRVLALDPYNTGSFLLRAVCRLLLDQPAVAAGDCWTALVLPDAGPADRGTAHAILSQAEVLAGRPDRAAQHGYLARTREPHLGPREGITPDTPEEHEALVEAHRHLAEYAINTRTDFETAAALYRGAEAARAGYAEWVSRVPATTLYLGEDWTRAIGHMALVDFWEKMRQMGWQRWDRMVLVAPPGATANPAYADYYRRYFKVLDGPPTPVTRHLAAALGPRVAGMLTVPGGGERYFLEGMGLIQEAWEAEGRGPLLRLTQEDADYGRRKLRKLGLPAGAWFVALHVRSSGFHKEGKAVHQSHRNADIESYLPAVREVVRRGGWVIRMGDPTMPALPPTPGLVDYAHSKHKSPRMDVFLCGCCRFFVGVASGISHVPTTFGVPCVMTNWLSNTLPVYSRRDLFLPKLLRSTRDGRVLPFDEYLAPATRLLCYSGEMLEEKGLETVDNTPEELRDVVAEMLDQLAAGVTPPPTSGVAGFDAIARGHGLAGFSRLGRAFAAKNANLLPETSAPHHSRVA